MRDNFNCSDKEIFFQQVVPDCNDTKQEMIYEKKLNKHQRWKPNLTRDQRWK